jgi:hypothetical protein
MIIVFLNQRTHQFLIILLNLVFDIHLLNTQFHEEILSLNNCTNSGAGNFW